MPYLNKQPLTPEPIDCKILTAALDLFVEKGYHNVSIHEVREVADVSIGSIYRYFGGKEGIAQALYKHIVNEVDELIDRVTQSISTPVEQLEEIIKQLFQHTETHRNIIAFVFHSKHADFLADQPLIFDAAPFIKIRQITAEVLDNDDLKDVNATIATSIIVGSAMRLIQMRLDGSIEEALTNYFDFTMNSIWNGIKPARSDLPLKKVNNRPQIAV
jgi:TetR/AcrR family transcriptional regulator, repressor of fatR-cypB operon